MRDGSLHRRQVLLFHVAEDFSRTTTASSMTIPTASVSASSVDDVERESMYAIAANVAISELGIATAAMRVGRNFFRNSQTIPAAKIDPRTRMFLHGSSAAITNSDDDRGPGPSSSPWAGSREDRRTAP